MKKQDSPFDQTTLNPVTMLGDWMLMRTPRLYPPRPPAPKVGWFDGLLLMIPDKLLPSRDGWYGRLYG